MMPHPLEGPQPTQRYVVTILPLHFAEKRLGQTEKGIDAQKRIVKEFYDTVEDYDP